LAAGRQAAASAVGATAHSVAVERSSSVDIQRPAALPVMAAMQSSRLNAYTTTNTQGLNFNHDQKKRFSEICRQNCIDRKIKLVNL